MFGGQPRGDDAGLAAALPHIRNKRVKPIAVTGLKRHELLPDVPTFEESGFKGFDGVQWYGIVGRRRCRAKSREAQRRDRKGARRRAPAAPGGGSDRADADVSGAVRRVHQDRAPLRRARERAQHQTGRIQLHRHHYRRVVARAEVGLHYAALRAATPGEARM